MGLKESLKKLQEDQEKDRKLSLKFEVEKELEKLKKDKIAAKKCVMCGNSASYSIKGSSDWYCRDCAMEYFGDLKNLKKKVSRAPKDASRTSNPYDKNSYDNIYFITGNYKKYLEVERILPGIKQIDLDLLEIQELDAKKIIEHKLLDAKKKFKKNSLKGDASFIVEDTSLYIDSMKGLPGPFIKWFLQTIGNDGLYALAKNSGNNKAEARTLIGYYDRGKIKYFQGIIKGKIVSPRKSDFGWDAIFKPEGYTKVMGEMTKEKKNSVSMRGMAARKLREYLEKK